MSRVFILKSYFFYCLGYFYDPQEGKIFISFFNINLKGRRMYSPTSNTTMNIFLSR